MNFSRIRSRRVALACSLSALLFLGACHRTMSNEERATRIKLRTKLRSHSYGPAVPLARRVLQFSPKDNGAWARLAQAQYGLGDLSGLRATLGQWQATIRKPGGKFYEYRGDLALADGRPNDALAAWQIAVRRKDRKARVFAKMARVEEKRGDWTAAAKNWQEVLSLQQSTEALFHRADCLRHLHQWDAALADLQAAQKLAPNDPLVRQANANFARLGKFLAEIRELDKTLAAQPNNADLLAERALLFLRASAPELALDDARRAARLAPDAVRPKLSAALALRAEGREAEAEKWGAEPSLRLESLTPDFLQTLRRLDAQIATEPRSADLRVSRAWQLNELGQPQLALADAQKAIALEPKSAGAHAEASYALAKLGQDSAAYADVKRATQLDPNFSTAWQYRGELEMRKTDYLAAIDSLTHALAINQTATALAKREECYRKLGLLAKAEADKKALDQIRPVR